MDRPPTPTESAPSTPAWLGLPAGWRQRAGGGVSPGPAVVASRCFELSSGARFTEHTAEWAATASPEGLRDTTQLLYEAACRGCVPLRFWNFVPGITDAAAGEAAHRYMVFNEGRAAGMADAGFEGSRVAASAVGFPPGHPAPRLTVQVLSGPAPAQPLENPRQVPAWRYSERFGRTPPTFARASVLPADSPAHPGAVLLAGTAAVVGEESVHPGDLRAQAAETFTNLAVLLAAAAGEPLAERATPGEEDRHLARLRHLRVYVTRSGDLPEVQRLVADRCPSLKGLRVMHAPLCRPELLLEAEGISENGLAG